MKPQTLAIFDLDYTLLEADSEALWCKYLFGLQVVDAAFIARIETFYRQYEEGNLDLHPYQAFLLGPLVLNQSREMFRLRQGYLELIRTLARPAMLEQVDWHRTEKHTLVLVTATNSFLAKPIAQLLGFSNLICTQLETKNGRFTGKISGVPAFQYGKVIRLTAWLQEKKLSLKGSWFYSDSHNDLPLLKMVDHPVMVTPDDILKRYGLERGWRIFERDDRETFHEESGQEKIV